MDSTLYNLSSGLQTHIRYLGLLTSTGFWAYKTAVDAKDVPKQAELVSKVEEACKIEKKKVLEILEDSKRQIEILIHSVRLQEGSDE